MSTEIKLKESTTGTSLATAGLAINKKDGTPLVPENLWADHLTAKGLDPKMDKKIQEERTTFIANAAHTIGEPAIEAMAKNKDIQNITVNIPMGHDKLALSIDRTRETSDGKGGRMEQHAYLTVGYTAVGAGQNRGELKKVREHLKGVGLAKLGA